MTSERVGKASLGDSDAPHKSAAPEVAEVTAL